MKKIVLIVLFLNFLASKTWAQAACQCPSESLIVKDLEKAVAENNASDVLKLAQKINQKEAICQAYFLKWQTWHFLIEKNWQKARQSLDNQTLILKKLKCKDFDFDQAFLRGRVYFVKNQYDSASHYYLQAQTLAEELKDEKRQIPALSGISLVFSRMGQTEKAIHYNQKIVQLAQKNEDKNALAKAIANLAGQYGQIYDKTKNLKYLDTTENLSNQNLPLLKAVKNTNFLISAYSALAGVHYIRKNYPKSLVYCDSALAIANPQKNTHQLFSTYYKKCDNYLMLKDFPKARQIADSAMKYAQKVGDIVTVSAVWEQISDCEEALGNHPKALQAFKKSTVLKDSIFKAEQTEIVNDLEQKYNKAQNEKTIRELGQEQEISHLRIRLLIGGIALSVLVVLLLVFLYRQNNLKNRQIILETEQRLQRARINPHFFFNILSSLQSFALQPENAEKVPIYLAKYAKLMRQILESSYQDLVSLAEEIDFLQNYLELQSLRFPHKFTFEFQMDKSLEIEDLQIPSMIIQPFVENSIEHGFKNINYIGHIQINFHLEANQLIIKVIDNGSEPISSQPVKIYPSRATEIIKDRIFLLNKSHRAQASFNFGKLHLGKGFQAHIALPILYK
ncbi:MAG: histidine kinase [Microscillaceae bacterium]|nr:histidine kinase [Microscillaceae bacterium]